MTRSRLCRFDNVSQDGVGMGAAEAVDSYHHPASNAGPRYPPQPPNHQFAISNPETEEGKGIPGWSTSELPGSH